MLLPLTNSVLAWSIACLAAFKTASRPRSRPNSTNSGRSTKTCTAGKSRSDDFGDGDPGSGEDVSIDDPISSPWSTKMSRDPFELYPEMQRRGKRTRMLRPPRRPTCRVRIGVLHSNRPVSAGRDLCHAREGLFFWRTNENPTGAES